MLVLAADQFTKNLVLAELPYQQSVPVWGDLLQFYVTRNPGAAFSLGEGVTWIFTIILAAAAVAILVLAVTRVRSWLWATVLGLLLGGIVGNLTDRLFREPGFPVGHVVDFIHTPWMMPAIYNIADVFIVTMMISVALLVLVGLKLDGTREPRHSSSPRDPSAAAPVADGADGADDESTADTATDADRPADASSRD